MELIKGNCPHCAKPLAIPSELKEFSCMYCGARSRIEELTKRVSAEQYETERAFLKENLPLTVTRYPDYYRKMTRKDFIPTFQTYEAENADILKHLDVCIYSAPVSNEACMKEICADLLDAIDANMKAQPQWQKEGKRQDLLFATRVVLAIFLTPLVRKMRLNAATIFRSELNRQWMERYPKHRWSPGDYEVLEAGYKKRGLCFITTATCQKEGKADDCEELTAFRAFRDGWLTENGYQSDIDLYYEIAPSIVMCIDHCDETEQCYAHIRETWLEPCYRALKEKRNEDCRALYTAMVQELQKKYFRQ